MLLFFCAIVADGQPQKLRAPVTVTVVDENGVAVVGAQVTISESGLEPAHLWTDYAGICAFALRFGATG